MARILIVCCMLLPVTWPRLSGVRAEEALGLRAPPGFTVTRFAADDLAHDLNSLTLDRAGRVVVSGPGFISTLWDHDGDGAADEAVPFANLPRSGARGMVFVGSDLYCTGDNALLRFADADGDGRADGPPETLFHLKNPEHGANGLVHGPDGWLYLICGNDAGVTGELSTTAGAPVGSPQSGAVVRFTPDGRKAEVFAHGFRNVYDLDFHPDGQLFTVDSDGERDHHLPWYAPTRLFDIAQGMHHGWVNSGWQKAWNRPEYYFDNVERLVEIGRGSPTGVAVYRHHQFPSPYAGGVFSCCWTLGRVYFFPLHPAAGTYQSQVEVFLETEGEVGFAPVDLAVGSDGELYVAIGGRRTQGGVFCVRYTGAAESEAGAPSLPPAESTPDPLAPLLQAPQPLAAWSRDHWLPLAQDLGPEALIQACQEAQRPVAERLRAIEVLVDVFHGIPPTAVERLADEREPRLLARLAWALSRSPPHYVHEATLRRLSRHADPRVARAAWEGLAAYPAERLYELPTELFAPAPEEPRRVRLARLLAYRRWTPTIPEWVESTLAFAPAETLLRRWVTGGLQADDFLPAVHLFQRSPDPAGRLDALRLISLALGDWLAETKRPEQFAGYELQGNAKQIEAARRSGGSILADAFPTGDRLVDIELARLLGGLRVAEEGLNARISQQWSGSTSPEHDLHYLFVLAQLASGRDSQTTRRTAEALVGLPRKMQQRGYYPSRNWPLRVGEAFAQLCRRDPQLAAEFVAWPEFGRAEHALFVNHLPAPQQEPAIRKLLATMQTAPEDTQWTPELVELVGRLPAAEATSTLRELWPDARLQDAVTVALSRYALPEDGPRLLEGLRSSQAHVVEEAARALAKLPPPPEGEAFLPVMTALQRQCSVPGLSLARAALGELLEVWTGELIHVPEGDLPAPRVDYEPWFAWFDREYPEVAERLGGLNALTGSAWQERLTQVDWEAGEAEQGREVFQRRSCIRCHQGASPLGPDLAGAATRFSRSDLFGAIVEPNKEVAPLYEVTQLTTAAGRIYRGLVIYESPESTLLQVSPNTTVRVAGDEIIGLQKVRQSLMPTGLLDDASPAELADLYAYLRTLRGR